MSDINEDVIEQEEINQLLAKLEKRVPGESFRLPSRGKFYKKGELDAEVEDGNIVIYPMNSLDELKMRSQDMLLNGTAITEVIANCVPQVLKPGKLLASDVDYVLTCLRKVSYGPLLPIKHKCIHCAAAEKEYNLSIDHFIANAKEVTDTQIERTTILVDNTFSVKLNPCTFDEYIKILQRSEMEFESVEQLNDFVNNSLLAVIISVDKITDKKKIAAWLAKIPPYMKEELAAKIEVLNQWGVEFSFEINCEECGGVGNLKSTLNPTGFFMLPSSQKT